MKVSLRVVSRDKRERVIKTGATGDRSTKSIVKIKL